jgi:hypothetical protein
MDVRSLVGKIPREFLHEFSPRTSDTGNEVGEKVACSLMIIVVAMVAIHFLNWFEHSHRPRLRKRAMEYNNIWNYIVQYCHCQSK